MKDSFREYLKLGAQIFLLIWILFINVLFYLNFFRKTGSQFPKLLEFVSELLHKW